MKWLILLGLFAALGLLVLQMARAGELPQEGEAAPDFELPDQHGVMHGLQQYAGKWLVLYFYPKEIRRAVRRRPVPSVTICIS